MSSQSEPPPLNVEAVRTARAYVTNPDAPGLPDSGTIIRDLLGTYENLTARYAYLAAAYSEQMDKQARRAPSPAHPSTMIEGGGQSG